MKDKLKNRIATYVDEIEKINDYTKELINDIQAIEKTIKESSDENEQKSLSGDHFALIQYHSLLVEDVKNRIYRVAECYMTSILLDVALELSEQELKIVDSYSKSAETFFVIDGGKVNSKQQDLLKIMKEKATSLKNVSFIDSYIANIKK